MVTKNGDIGHKTPLSPRGGERVVIWYWTLVRALPLLLWAVGAGAASKTIPSTATVAADLGTAWGGTFTTANLGTSNNGYANTGTNAVASGTLSGFSFSSIPSNAGIEGITVNIEASETHTGVTGLFRAPSAGPKTVGRSCESFHRRGAGIGIAEEWKVKT